MEATIDLRNMLPSPFMSPHASRHHKFKPGTKDEVGTKVATLMSRATCHEIRGPPAIGLVSHDAMVASIKRNDWMYTVQ
jgi:hypothetical protein